MNPGGRPKLPEGLARNSTVNVRFTDDERAALDRAAANIGLSVSTWARIKLLKAAGVQLDPLPTRPEPPEPATPISAPTPPRQRPAAPPPAVAPVAAPPQAPPPPAAASAPPAAPAPTAYHHGRGLRTLSNGVKMLGQNLIASDDPALKDDRQRICAECWKKADGLQKLGGFQSPAGVVCAGCGASVTAGVVARRPPAAAPVPHRES